MLLVMSENMLDQNVRKMTENMPKDILEMDVKNIYIK